MWVLRRIASISWKEKVRNEEVLKRLGVKKELLSNVKTSKLAYLGHVLRHDSLQKTILT